MIKLNPNKLIVEEIRKKIKDNNGYCCCMFVKNEDTKCPCKNFREEQECVCNLYVNIKE